MEHITTLKDAVDYARKGELVLQSDGSVLAIRSGAAVMDATGITNANPGSFRKVRLSGRTVLIPTPGVLRMVWDES